jgi:hypothetical protein
MFGGHQMMRRMSVGLLAAVCCAMLIASPACTPSTPTPFLASTPGAAQTVYAGTVTDSVSGSGTISVSVVNVQGLVSGTRTATFAGKPHATEYISGSQSGTTYTATVSLCPETDQSSSTCSPDCRLLFSGSLTSTSLTGNYTVVSNPLCQAESGNVSASH